MYLPHYWWALTLAASICLWSALWVMPRYGVFASSLLAYLGFSGLYVWVFVENRFVTVNPYDQMALRYFAADSVARLLILLAPLMAAAENRKNFLDWGTALCRLFVCANSAWILLELARTGCKEVNYCGGAGNPSIMAGLSVCMLPVAVRDWRKHWAVFALCALAVMSAKSSVALGLLGIYLGLSFLEAKKLWAFAAVSILPLVFGYFLLGKLELFSTGNRLMIWEYMMPAWAKGWNIPLGTGFGTYHVFSINMQAAHRLEEGVHWNTLHNDWLQMLFECGVGGLLLSLGTYFSALWKSFFEERRLALSILLYGIYMGVNPALHHALPALFGAWLFLGALKRKPSTLHLVKESYA